MPTVELVPRHLRLNWSLNDLYVKTGQDQTEYKKELATKINAQIRQPCRNQLNKKELAAAEGDYPAILAYNRGSVIKLVGSNEIDSCDGDFDCLKAKLNAAIGLIVPSFL